MENSLTIAEFESYPADVTGFNVLDDYTPKMESWSKVGIILRDLNFDLEIEDVINELIKYINTSQSELQFSKSDEDEFVLFQQTPNETWKNLLIDEDGNIELIVVPKDRKKTFNKHYMLHNNYNLASIVNNFNELQ